MTCNVHAMAEQGEYDCSMILQDFVVVHHGTPGSPAMPADGASSTDPHDYIARTLVKWSRLAMII